MTDYGTTDTSTTTLATNQFPNSSVFIPGDTKLTVLGGANKLTDGGGKTYAEALMHVADGSDVTQGTSTDANTINSVMGRLTKIRDLLNGTIAVSAASLPLPTGASTSAKQPALGTAGTASADVLTVQGIASMTALKVDGSGVTQPISGTITANQGGTWTVQPGNTVNTTAWLITPQATTAGGSTPYHLMSAASTNATSVKATAGLLYGLSISNANAAARFFKLYDKAGAPTVGTDVPKRTIQVPANGTVITAFPVGLAFALGIAFSTNTGISDADTGAVGANDLSIDLDYK